MKCDWIFKYWIGFYITNANTRTLMFMPIPFNNLWKEKYNETMVTWQAGNPDAYVSSKFLKTLVR